jgi:hypothetical protein
VEVRLPLALLSCSLAFAQEIEAVEAKAPKRALADAFPGDRGIAKDKRVLLHEDFESAEWHKRWSNVKGLGKQTVVQGEVAHAGKRAVRITATRDENTGGHLYRMLKTGAETLHLRFYVRFEKEHGFVHHFVHLCGYHPATPWPQGGAGVRPDGGKRFSTGIEPTGVWGRFEPPGVWNFYSYWCEMNPARDGKYWGNVVRPRPDRKVARDRWICVEVMLKCNDLGKRNGEQALWLDGKPAGRWSGYRWRTISDLKVNAVWMLYYITGNESRQNRVASPRRRSVVWFDDIVAATTYVGPRVSPKSRR